MIVGSISQDNLISAPAWRVWEIYRGFNLGHFINKHLSHVIGTVDFIEGDGGPGSVLRLTYPPGTPGAEYVVEKFTIMDDKNRVKETPQVEGGYLALGFTCFVIRFQIIEKSPGSSIVRTTFEYGIDEDLAENISLISFRDVNIVAKTVDKHLAANKTDG